MKLMMCEIDLYPEHYPDINEIVVICNNYKSIEKYAVILHDKEDVKPHYHVMLHFASSFETDKLMTWFHDLPDYLIRKMSSTRYSSAIAYLTHENTPEKYQYARSLVLANFDINPCIDGELKLKTELLPDFAKILDNFRNGTYKLYISSSIPIGLKDSRHYRDVERAYAVYSQEVLEKKKEDGHRVSVIFMQGSTASSKTRWAQEKFAEQGLSVYVSGANNDPMQSYKGQDVLILDDLRWSTFDYVDLLKITDNYTRTDIHSRYMNKAFIGSYIVITTFVPFDDWYPEIRNPYSGEGDTKLQQLTRRIDYQLVFDDNGYISQLNLERNPKSRLYEHKFRSMFVNPYYGENASAAYALPEMCILTKNLEPIQVK